MAFETDIFLTKPVICVSTNPPANDSEATSLTATILVRNNNEKSGVHTYLMYTNKILLCSSQLRMKITILDLMVFVFT